MAAFASKLKGPFSIHDLVMAVSRAAMIFATWVDARTRLSASLMLMAHSHASRGNSSAMALAKDSAHPSRCGPEGMAVIQIAAVGASFVAQADATVITASTPGIDAAHTIASSGDCCAQARASDSAACVRPSAGSKDRS